MMNTVSRLFLLGAIIPILITCEKPWYHLREARTAGSRGFECSTGMFVSSSIIKSILMK